MNTHIKVLVCTTLFLISFCASSTQQPKSRVTTGWHNAEFHVDVAGVVHRSDVVLARPNETAIEALPLGNGRLGVSVWSAAGFTAQLNRWDTMPHRLSPGQVVVPGLAKLTGASDYSGRLDLFNGEFRESGGGMSATAYVESDKDMLILTVSGANPNELQTAELKLWAPRNPAARAGGGTGTLSESWKDDKVAYGSGRAFGTLAAITAKGRDVSALVTDPRTVSVSFKPFADGHFEVAVAVPHFDGSQNAEAVAQTAFGSSPSSSHRAWWNSFWNRAGFMKIASPDGAGEYMENLRDLDLFVTAISKGEQFPGYHAGVADMINSAEDEESWDASAYWHWNMRHQIAVDIGAGSTELNASYFNLYRENLRNILNWTKSHMAGRPGACIPETMRFNGRGYETETWVPKPALNCAEDSKPYYNARTISTGAEVSLWVWQQYLATGDRRFLAENYPIMAASARFLLAYQKPGADGLLHTQPSNAHETQWDVVDPTTDLAAIKALYPATIQAAKILNTDSALGQELEAALKKTPAFPRIDPQSPTTLLPPSADADGKDVIASSYRPGAENHNIENIGLEPVWPYNLIGDDSPMLELARRTFAHRPYVSQADWSFDPIQAARLGLGSEVSKTLIEITQKYQKHINGLAHWAPAASKQFFVEQSAVVADALQEALVQDYDGLIRIAPAIPPGWDFDGSVFVHGRTKVDVQVRDGVPTTVVIESGTKQQIKLRNPWVGQPTDVVDGKSGAPVVDDAKTPIISFAAIAGARYLVKKHAESPLEFAPVSGEPATSAKALGSVQIGLFAKGH